MVIGMNELNRRGSAMILNGALNTTGDLTSAMGREIWNNLGKTGNGNVMMHGWANAMDCLRIWFQKWTIPGMALGDDKSEMMIAKAFQIC